MKRVLPLCLILAPLAAALLLTSCAKVEAQATPVTDTLTWVLPTQNTDGSALPAASIAKTTIVWGTASGGPYTAGTQDVAAPATSLSLTRSSTGVGTRCYKASVTTTTAAGGQQSQWSTEACKTVVAPPNAPTGLSVQ